MAYLLETMVRRDSLKNSSLTGNGRVRELGVKPLELIEHIGLDIYQLSATCARSQRDKFRKAYLERGLDKRLTQPREGDDDKLVFPGQVSP